jgi:hypothetical protein
MISAGVDPGDVSALTSIHMLPIVVLFSGDVAYTTAKHCKGVLNGSRTASFIAICPVADAIVQCTDILAANGIRLAHEQYLKCIHFDCVCSDVGPIAERWVNTITCPTTHPTGINTCAHLFNVVRAAAWADNLYHRTRSMLPNRHSKSGDTC